MVKEFNTEKFIDYLRRKNLKLDKDDIKILYKEKISDLVFLELMKEKFHSIGFIRTNNNTCKIYQRSQSKAIKLFLV